MALLLLLLTSVTISCVATTPWLRPGYHFTRAAHHMNDPNGLMWKREANGSISYHMYFQSIDPGQSIGSIWGHAVSPDLVNWQRLPRTSMRGSSGGGVPLPPDFVPPPQLAGAKAFAVSSVPMSPSQNPPTGLHLWYSTDDTLVEWTEYRNESSVQNSTNATCVICPGDIPPEHRPGYIGDNYVWLETNTYSTDKRHKYTFYVLAGSTRCSKGHPWCSYEGVGGNSTAQAFVFHSTDLLHWKMSSNWNFLPKQNAWPAGFPHTGQSQWPGQRIDTPDTFPIVDIDTGKKAQAFVWLHSAGCPTHWMIGAMDKATKNYIPSTHIGCADKGALLCQQSLTTPQGDRVSFGWVSVSGDGWDGAQSLPRVVTFDTYGLAYRPLPQLSSLHLDYCSRRHHSLQAGATEALGDVSQFGGHVHIVLAAKMITSQQLTLSLLGGACHVKVEFDEGLQSWQVHAGGIAIGSVRPSLVLESSVELFVDGSIVEVYFAGEAVTAVFPQASSQNVTLSAGGTGNVFLNLDAWKMDSSVVGSETIQTESSMEGRMEMVIV